jgi:toxin ParE1/3/4
VKPLIIHADARAELDQSMAHYEEQLPGLGLDLQAEVERTLGDIQENPLLGSPYKSTKYRFWVVRRFSFVVFYRELETAIWIAAIAHGSRRPGYWRRRRIE